MLQNLQRRMVDTEGKENLVTKKDAMKEMEPDEEMQEEEDELSSTSALSNRYE